MNLVTVYDQYTPLRYTRRFSRFYCASPINVMEHSYLVAILGGVLAQSFHESVAGWASPSRVVWKGLRHDECEALTGDIPHDVKRLSEVLHDDLERLDDRLTPYFDGLGSGACDVNPAEAALVKMADWVELILYADKEEKAGNASIRLPANRIWDLLHGKLAPDFDKIEGAGPWFRETLKGLRRALDPHSTVVLDGIL